MNECIFCKIIRGEIPALKLYEDDGTIAVLDVQPVHAGHTLVISKDDKSNNILDIAGQDWASMSETVRKLSRAIERATKADGINVLMNNGSHAGQVIEHPHVHIIPRFKGDGLDHWSKSSFQEGEAKLMQEKIRDALEIS